MKMLQNHLDNQSISDNNKRDLSVSDADSLPDGAEHSDETLCRMAEEGDPYAAELLVLRYNRLVRVCCRPLFLMGASHEDLIQEGMLGLALAIRSYRRDRGASFHTYAERCIRNRILTAIRTASSGRHEALNTALPLDAETEDRPSYAGDPETRLIDTDAFQERLRRYQGMLSPLERQVLELYLQGMSYEEISRTLHRSGKSVDNAVQRIRKKLR